jgi:hypothetical protein
MDIVGDRKFVEVPGGKTHELPPLLVNAVPKVKRLDRVMSMAESIIESEDLIPNADLPIPDLDRDRRKMDLAVNLVDQYLTLVTHWQWGDSILEWIRQCETTFGSRAELRNLLRTEIWPHAGRSSFVQLLADKAVNTDGVALGEAVGLRLTFRQPPPISCCTNEFLFYLNATVANGAYDAWVHLTPSPVSCLPPERFNFEVVNMSLQ